MASDQYEYPDLLPTLDAKGRGAANDPANRFESARIWTDGDEIDRRLNEKETVSLPQLRTVAHPDQTQTAINYVDPKVSPDIGFRWTINPYRGCEHGCIYCYARPTHEFLGWTSGIDFETQIMVKHDAPRLLERELSKPSWEAETIMMSGVTDPYQPLEREFYITRRCLEVMLRFGQPVTLITKNALILRDLDIIKDLAARRLTGVAISLTSLDPDLSRIMEPRASRPADRLRAIRELSAAGVPVSVMTAPMIPGLNDHEMPALLEAAADAGATSAGWVMLRLPYQLKSLFLSWLQKHFPLRAAKVESFIRDVRGGAMYDTKSGRRMGGTGPHADRIAKTFEIFSKRHGLTKPRPDLDHSQFRRPGEHRQLGLFGG